MSSDGLYERVAAYVAAHPGAPVVEVARGVRARVQSVRFVLRMEGFTHALLTSERGREYVGHYATANAGERRGRAGRW